MRRLSKLALAMSCAAILSCCLAGGASAAVEGINATVTQNPSDLSEGTVEWSANQLEAGAFVAVRSFAVNAWDDECSSAGWPYTDLGFWPYFAVSDVHAFDTTSDSGTDSLELPAGPAMCVGAAWYREGEMHVSATPIHYDRPSWDFGDDSATGDSLTIQLVINPGGLPTSYYLSYFKAVNTTNCQDPDPDDLATEQDTETGTIDENLWFDNGVSPTITGLEPETSYCVSTHVHNAAGGDDTIHWVWDTAGPPPAVSDVQFSGVVGQLDFSLSLIPGSNNYDPYVFVKFFKKYQEDCSDPDNHASAMNYIWPDSPPRGFEPVTVSGRLPGFDEDSDYCVRALAESEYGQSPPDEYTLVHIPKKTDATISDPRLLGPNKDSDRRFTAQLNDNGAYNDTGSLDNYLVTIYTTAPGQCNDDFFGLGSLVYSGEWQPFQGVDTLVAPLDGLSRETTYCARVQVNSAWGSDFDGLEYFQFTGGAPVAIGEYETERTSTTIKYNVSIDPGDAETEFQLAYFEAPGDVACSDYTGAVSYGGDGSVEENVSSVQTVHSTITGLEPETMYCVRFAAGNTFGGNQTGWSAITTLPPPDTTSPSKPANLHVTHTANVVSLAWDSATDNVGVTTYKLYRNGELVQERENANADVEMACGTTAHFRVSAVDAQGNESDKSDDVLVSGAACPVIDPPQPPASRTCVAPVKSASVTLRKGKKKIKATVSGVVAPDMQSVKLAARAKGATISFSVNGKKTRGSSITLSNDPALVTVSFKLGGKTKTVKVKVSTFSC